jgi:hypothetical protein
MNGEPLTCPYCNATVSLSPGAAAGQRVVCPRCGDTFTLRPGSPGIVEVPAVTGVTTAPAPARLDVDVRAPSRRSNRTIAAVIVAGMVLLAGGALVYMVRTQDIRRAHDTGGFSRRPKPSPVPGEPGERPPEVVPPDRWAALGYLPKGTSLVAGARLPELRATKAGRDLLDAPLALGHSEFRLSEVARLGELNLEQIDHLVLGVRIEELLPSVVLVLHTTGPVDREALVKSLRGRRAVGARPETYEFTLPDRNLTLALWFADDRTLVIVGLQPHLEGVPGTPAADLALLPDEVRDVLRQRRDPGSALWAVGHADDWSKTLARPLVERLEKQGLTKMSGVRTFGAWLNLADPVAARLDLGCKDDETARSLEGSFLAMNKGGGAPVKAAREGDWLSVQLGTDPEAVRRLLRR